MRTVSGAKPKSATSSLHFFERERGAERIGEEFALVGVGVAGVGVDQMLAVRLRRAAGEVAVELQAAGRGDADRFGDDGSRLGDMVDDAVADDGVETSRRRTASCLASARTRSMRSVEAGGGDVLCGRARACFRRRRRR